MHSHSSDGSQHSGHAHDEPGLAALLDLDAAVLGAWADEATAWAAQHAPEPRRVVDVGAGTGTGTRALARRFPTAELVAVDRSGGMLERLRQSADGLALTHRLRLVEADLDVGWPQIGAVDLAWASSSLHEVADPDRLLRDLRAALTPGGLLVVVEMDSLPGFLPDELASGLEARCLAGLAEAGWNAHPDWGPHLEGAGLEVVGTLSISTEADATATAGRYAQAHLRRVRGALSDRLADGDLATLDRLIADDGPDAVVFRRDLRVRGRRTAWAARRPLSDTTPLDLRRTP